MDRADQVLVGMSVSTLADNGELPSLEERLVELEKRSAESDAKLQSLQDSAKKAKAALKETSGPIPAGSPVVIRRLTGVSCSIF
jgi:hypothetical protein